MPLRMRRKEWLSVKENIISTILWCVLSNGNLPNKQKRRKIEKQRFRLDLTNATLIMSQIIIVDGEEWPNMVERPEPPLQRPSCDSFLADLEMRRHMLNVREC